jgi:hypothetical protein
MTDDDGVLGNLPRSRPGQRSEKRASRAAGGARTSKTTAAAASRAERSGAKAAAPAAGARPKSTARPKPSARARRTAGRAAGEPQVSPPAAGADPVREAIRGVAGIAWTGAKVATGVTREVLRRLPRP